MSASDGPRWNRLTDAASRLHRGEIVAVVVVVAYVLFVGVTAATAPPIDVGEVSNGSDVYVGTQGPFQSAEGYALRLGSDTSVEWESPEAWAHFDVDRLENGHVLAGFMVRGQQNCGPYDSPCARTGFRIYDPGAADPIVREWTMPVRSHVNSEVHDATMLPDGEIAVSDMEHERVIVVDESGEITWQWNASSYYDAPPDPTRTDWLHINDLDYLGDGEFLVSVRNANQLLVINREKEVVEVVNEDRDPSVMREQHNPQYLADDRIMVADSGNDRVVELRKRDGEWEVGWSLERAGGLALHWPRDADVLQNGNVLVTDSLNDRVFEVRRNGTVVWSTSTRTIPYEADYNGTEYAPNVSNASPAGPAGGTGDDGGTSEAIPQLSAAYSGVVGALALPYWFSMTHFVGLFVVVLAVLVGLGSTVYHRVL